MRKRVRAAPRSGSVGRVTEQPIAPIAPAVTAFIGIATSGPVGEPRLVTSMSHFTKLYGGLSRQSHLGYSVRDFYRHGGRLALVIRIDPDIEVTQAQLDGLQALRAWAAAEPVDDPVALVVVPPGGFEAGDWADPSLDVLRDAVATAEQIKALVVLDAPAAWDTLTPSDGAADMLESLRSSHAAMYFPRLVEPDPLTGEPLILSPSGAVAGVISRTDLQYGPWDAPSGTGTTALDVDGLTVVLDQQRVEQLAQLRVNALRSFHGTGPLVWGARVLGLDPDWPYVPTVRTAMFLEHSIERGLLWATTGQNGEPLWERVRARVEEFFGRLFELGAFPGATRHDAYFVRCDRTTMTQADVDAGLLRVEVGFASTRPAEFVVLRIELAVGQGG